MAYFMNKNLKKKWDTIAIIGIGLIGGSIGMTLRRRGLAKHVIGIGRKTSRLRGAKQMGALTAITTNIAGGVADAELIVVCTPVRSIPQLVREAAATCPPGSLITDVGSTKTEIVASLRKGLPEKVTFLGSHPLAGSEKEGYRFAQGGLFEERVTVITPSPSTPPAAIRRLSRFWTDLGARVVQMSARQHDRALAGTSHLPHLVASVLAASTPAEDLPLTGRGWLDTTRVASGETEMWQQILLSNQGHILKSLDKFEKLLASLRRALHQEDSAKIYKILEAGKQNRDAVGD